MYLISASFRKFLLASELLITGPRTWGPCVISTFLPAYSVDAWRSPPGLIINWHFGGLTRYPYLGLSWVSLSKSALISFNLPTTLPSSAYHFCVKESLWSLDIRGRIAIPYIAIARGSPCVLPSWDRMSTDRCRDETDGYRNSVRQHAMMGKSLSRFLMLFVFWAH